MIDCISRQMALDFHIPTCDLNISPQDERALGDRFEEFLKSIPAADVVEVVRCGECMFWDAPPSCEGLARCQTGESGVRFRKAYDFCSRGCKKDERRSDDDYSKL